MEIKNFEPSIDINVNGRNLVSEACKWIGELFTAKVKEKDLAVVTATQACEILYEIKSSLLFIQECYDQAKIDGRVVDVAINLVDMMRNNYKVVSREISEDFILF